MFINYILSSWRSLLKNKVISIINIGGLTIGLASAVLAILFAHHELTYESSHKKADRVSKVYIRGNFDQIQWIPTTFGPEGPTIKSLFPEVEEFTRAHEVWRTLTRVGENIFFEENIFGVDSSYYSIFTIPFVLGGPSPELNTVVISERVAQRYFGSVNPLGQTMTINLHNQKNDFLVTGVYTNLPSNTHLKAEMLIPLDFFKRSDNFRPEEYSDNYFNTYLLLKEGTDYKSLNKKIEEQVKIPVDIENVSAFLIPLKEIHLRGTWENNKGKLLVFLISGFFVLIITCLNYINLTNILFSTRNKEIGIRKVNGARQKHIFFQFLTDTMLSTVIAFNLAIIIIKIALPWFNSLMDTNISLEPRMESLFVLLLVLIATIILSGLYPALRYSYQKPVNLIKPVASILGGKGYSRRIITTFQFFLAIVFIQFMMAINKHGEFLNDNIHKKYNSDNVICVPGGAWGDLNKVKDELKKSPYIESVSWGSTVPEMGGSLTKDWKDKGNKTVAIIARFAPDYTDVFNIKMTSGNFFSNDFPSDLEQGIVINKLTADLLGYTDPVGQIMMYKEKNYKIIGVIDSYRAIAPIFDIMPMIIISAENTSNHIVIRIDGQNREVAQNYIKTTLKQFNPEYPIEINYHSDLLVESKNAKSFISAAQLMNLFFYLTILTSLVGLFGLSLFIAQRNRKEVGIRKVMGASNVSVMLRLSKGLIIQVLIAICLATPLSMVSVRGYLSVFPGNFQLGFPFYLMGGGIALLLVLVTVSWQTWSAARANPTEALRSE